MPAGSRSNIASSSSSHSGGTRLGGASDCGTSPFGVHKGSDSADLVRSRKSRAFGLVACQRFTSFGFGRAAKARRSGYEAIGLKS